MPGHRYNPKKPPFPPLPLHFKVLLLIFIRVHSRVFAAKLCFKITG